MLWWKNSLSLSLSAGKNNLYIYLRLPTLCSFSQKIKSVVTELLQSIHVHRDSWFLAVLLKSIMSNMQRDPIYLDIIQKENGWFLFYTPRLIYQACLLQIAGGMPWVECYKSWPAWHRLRTKHSLRVYSVVLYGLCYYFINSIIVYRGSKACNFRVIAFGGAWSVVLIIPDHHTIQRD